jgi:hypothetical protein
MAAFLLTMITGVVGVVAQCVLPRRLMVLAPNEVAIGQAPHLCAELRRQADEQIDELVKLALPDKKDEIHRVYRGGLRRYFYEGRSIRALWSDPWPSVEKELQQQASLENQEKAREGPISALNELWQARRAVSRQQWLHWCLHAWLFIHVPASVVLLLLGAWHGVLSLWF